MAQLQYMAITNLNHHIAINVAVAWHMTLQIALQPVLTIGLSWLDMARLHCLEHLEHPKALEIRPVCILQVATLRKALADSDVDVHCKNAQNKICHFAQTGCFNPCFEPKRSNQTVQKP